MMAGSLNSKIIWERGSATCSDRYLICTNPVADRARESMDSTDRVQPVDLGQCSNPDINQ